MNPVQVPSNLHGFDAIFNAYGAFPTLFYRNAEVLPGLVDVQSALLDDAATLAPREQVQTAERLPWMATAHALPAHERYPAA